MDSFGKNVIISLCDIHLPTSPWTESLLLIQHYAVQLPSICLQL